MKRLQTILRTANAWQVRIVALAFIVISVAGGSHILVNAFAATANASIPLPSATTSISISVPMHITQSHIVIRHVPFTGSQPVGTANK